MLKIPGLVDIHTHLRTPGQTEKEDFLSGTSAALAGGFTQIIDMPNNKIPITTSELLLEKETIAKHSTVCDIGFHFGSLGDNFSEFSKVSKKVFGLKLYLNETTGNFLIDKDTLHAIFDNWNGGPILVHAEDDAIPEVIKNVSRTKKPAHFCHISLQSDLEQIIAAKENGLPVTCGVTPHHLFLSQENSQNLGPYGKMKPYLKSDKDTKFLWQHLNDIDIIESDHAPHTKAQKESDNPPFGVPGLETTLPLLLTAVNNNKITINDVLRLCHTNPITIFHIPKQNSYVEIDMDEAYTIENDKLFTKSKWSPFNNWNMKGKIKKTVIDDIVVFEDGKIFAKPGSGRVIYPAV